MLSAVFRLTKLGLVLVIFIDGFLVFLIQSQSELLLWKA